MILAMILALAPLPPIESPRGSEDLCAKYADYEATETPEDLDEEEHLELAEAYANARGVRRDLDASIHHLCQANLAPAELWGMLTHIEQVRAGEHDEPLEFCEFSTSGYGASICASRRDDKLRPQLATRFESIEKGAGPTRAALRALRKRADAFIEAQAHWLTEQTRGGTIYASMGVNTLLDGEETLVSLLEEFTKARAAEVTAEEEERADAALNATYVQMLELHEPCDPDDDDSCPEDQPPNQENLRAAQRAWIPYRDAFIAWYVERWKDAAPEETLRREILTRLTRDRVTALEYGE